jgi:hypothetical protein
MFKLVFYILFFASSFSVRAQILDDLNKVLNHSFSKHVELIDSIYGRYSQDSHLKYPVYISVGYLFYFSLDTLNQMNRILIYEDGMFSRKEWVKGVSIFQISKIDLQGNRLQVVVTERFYKKARFRNRRRVTTRFGLTYFYEFDCEREVWKFVRWE